MDMGDLRRQAAHLLARARQEGRQIVEHATHERDQILAQAREQAFEQGRAEGLEAGLAQGAQQGRDEAFEQHSQQLQTLETEWRDAAQGWQDRRDQIEREARRQVVEFAVLFAGKLVHRVIEVDENVIADQVAVALEQVMRPLEVTVAIHPDDRPVVERALPDLIARIGGLEQVRITDDPAVGRGGCMVRYGEGCIDATIDKQIQRVAELILPESDPPDAAPVPAATPARQGDDDSEAA